MALHDILTLVGLDISDIMLVSNPNDTGFVEIQSCIYILRTFLLLASKSKCQLQACWSTDQEHLQCVRKISHNEEKKREEKKILVPIQGSNSIDPIDGFQVIYQTQPEE